MGNLVLHALSVYPCTKQEAPANQSLGRIRREERGQCPNCGIQTYEKKTISLLRSVWVPLTNDDVKKGRCLECFPPRLEVLAKAEIMDEDEGGSIIYFDPSRVQPLPPQQHRLQGLLRLNTLVVSHQVPSRRRRIVLKVIWITMV
jgi:hypothetical protein